MRAIKFLGNRYWSSATSIVKRRTITSTANVIQPTPSSPSSGNEHQQASNDNKKTEESKPSATPPPPVKETFKERTRIYLKSLYSDYKEVCVDTVKDAKAKPKKAIAYIFIVGGVLYCIWSTPGERSYYEEFIERREELDLVAKPIRNPDTEKYLEDINKLWMKGTLRYQNCGLFSIMWKHNEDECVANYDAACSYTKPLYSEIIWDRLIDIGFLNKWWILERKMIDFDVNYKEWENTNGTANQNTPNLSITSMLNKF